MEENKDFEKKQSEEQGTQQMPDTPGGNNGDGGKKAMVKLFGHEFDKKKVVMAGLGGGFWFLRWRAGASPTP